MSHLLSIMAEHGAGDVAVAGGLPEVGGAVARHLAPAPRLQAQVPGGGGAPWRREEVEVHRGGGSGYLRSNILTNCSLPAVQKRLEFAGLECTL